jgi:ABC-type uncharacterized transport system permease subunit
MNLPQLPADKANHFVYGACIATVVSLVTHHPTYGLLAAVAAGVVKELIDAAQNYLATKNPMVGPHGVSILDAAATVAGGVVASWTGLLR